MRTLSRRQRTAAIVLAVIAVGFITLDLGGGSLQNAHSGVRGMLGSLYRGTDSVIGPVRRWAQGVPSAGSHESEIQHLEAENATLRGELARNRSDERTSAQVSKLQRAADGGNHTVLPGRVIGYGPGQGFDWTVTVDVGRDDGVRDGQSVTDGAGLVGRVLNADSSSAVILLAADPGSGVGVRDARSGELGIATGAGKNGFTFVPLDPDASVRAGDVLSTGPVGSTSFVAGLTVGTVTSVRTSADGTRSATVDPIASPTSVDLVGIIIDKQTPVAGRDALRPGGR